MCQLDRERCKMAGLSVVPVGSFVRPTLPLMVLIAPLACR